MGSIEVISDETNEAEQLLKKFFGQVGHDKIMDEVKLFRDGSIDWHIFKIRIMVVSHGMVHTGKYLNGISFSWPKYPREESSHKRVFVVV